MSKAHGLPPGAGWGGGVAEAGPVEGWYEKDRLGGWAPKAKTPETLRASRLPLQQQHIANQGSNISGSYEEAHCQPRGRGLCPGGVEHMIASSMCVVCVCVWAGGRCSLAVG